MAKKTTMALAIILVLAFVLSLTATAEAAPDFGEVHSPDTEIHTIELETRSVLLVDRSGSMGDREKVDDYVSQMDTVSYDVVLYFDDKQSSTDPTYVGGGDSYICEKINEMATSGFTHIDIITDGQQWPQNYEALGIYTDLDIKFFLVEETEDSKELIDNLKTRLVNSSLKVITFDGEEEAILDGFEPPIYSIEVPRPTSTVVLEEGNGYGNSNSNSNNCKWWLALILGMLSAAVFDFIHELITRRRDNIATKKAAAKPMPATVVSQIKKGKKILADFSGSMANQQLATAEACKKAGLSEKIMVFGNSVSFCRPWRISWKRASGMTAGWEAIQKALEKGWKDIMVISDLDFNKKSFEEVKLSGKFNSITVVSPAAINQAVLDELSKITDEIEVVHL